MNTEFDVELVYDELTGEVLLPIPSEIVERLGLKDGDVLDVSVEDGRMIISYHANK